MQPYKVCPQCQQPAALDAPQCLRCGRPYRTQFTPPLQQTQVFSAQPANPPGSKPFLKVLLPVGALAVILLIVLVTYRLRYTSPLLGTWISRDMNTELTFNADHTAKVHVRTSEYRFEGMVEPATDRTETHKWYTQQDQVLGNDILGGFLLIGEELDYNQQAYEISADGKHLRIIYKAGGANDYYRPGVTPPAPDYSGW